MDAFLLSVFAMAGLLLVRNHLAYRIATRRISVLHERVMARIKAGIYDSPQEPIPSHEALMFDLRCWNYEQFFPEKV